MSTMDINLLCVLYGAIIQPVTSIALHISIIEKMTSATHAITSLFSRYTCLHSVLCTSTLLMQHSTPSNQATTPRSFRCVSMISRSSHPVSRDKEAINESIA